MTNEYQELLKQLPFISLTRGQYNLLEDAVRAGAEGRILPVLPQGWKYCHVWKDVDGYGSRIDCPEIEDLFYEGYGLTPAEAMQNAIEKIGGE